jgi:DNA-binding CsgD family transcriptional regulator
MEDAPMEQLSDDIVIKQISTLTNREKQVFRKMCSGDTYQEIADKHFVNIETIRSQSKEIYRKLDLKKHKNSDTRRKILNKYYCPLIDRQDIDTAPEPNPETQEIVIIPKIEEELIDKMVDEDDGKIPYLTVIDSNNKLDPVQNKFIPPPRRGIPIWVQILLLILAGIGFREVLSPILGLEPEVSVIEKEVTVIVPATAEPNQPTQEGIIQQIIVTATSPPPTPTDVPAPVLEPGYVFSDNFDLGPDPAWEVIYGEPGMANGKYTVISPINEIQTTHFSLLSNLLWENVSIEIEMSEYARNSSRGAIFAVVIHYDSNNGGVGLYIAPSSDGIQFATISNNGEWTLIGSSLVDDNINLGNGANIIRLDVNGDNYFAYLNNSLFTSATIKGYDKGHIGFWMKANNISDTPKYYAPRIDNITIESLP